MQKEYYKNKRIIWKSRDKKIQMLIVYFLFVAAGFLTKDRSSTWVFWVGIVFFGAGGLLELYQLLDPRNLFVSPKSQLGKEIIEDQFKKSLVDPGRFSYTDSGFVMTDHDQVTNFEWSDIETVFGYKLDRYSTDEICMDIFISGKRNFQLTESSMGWFVFNEKLAQNIATIPPNWYIKIAYPAFKTNLTLLFDKKGRTQQEVEAQCYI